MDIRSPTYHSLAEFYEACLIKHGATPLGVDWPNQQDVHKRFKVMLELIKNPLADTIQLLDLGCGYGALIEYVTQLNPSIIYTGMDVSTKMIQTAKKLHPKHRFLIQDILQQPLIPDSYDYIIMNGLLTEKRELSFHAMLNFAESMIKAAFTTARRGIAFNIMSYEVDWCDLNLFYWSFDALAAFLAKNCTRHFILRHDYGLYEYTIYLYKQPNG